MSSAFTTPVTERDAFKLGDVISETVQAYRERKAVADFHNMPARVVAPLQPAESDSYQDFHSVSGEDPWDDDYDRNDWRVMIRQMHNGDWLQSSMPSFVADASSPFGGLGVNSVPGKTQTIARTESGLTSGFRRATEWDTSTDDWTDYADGMFSYGYPAYGGGDICGPWLLEDLQDYLSVLKWSLYNGDLDASNYPRMNASGPAAPADTLNSTCDIYKVKKSDSTLVFHESLTASSSWPRTGLTTVDTVTYTQNTVWILKWDWTNSN